MSSVLFVPATYELCNHFEESKVREPYQVAYTTTPKDLLQSVVIGRQLAVSLFGNMIGQTKNTYEHQKVSKSTKEYQRVSDVKIQITILILTRALSRLRSSH